MHGTRGLTLGLPVAKTSSSKGEEAAAVAARGTQGKARRKQLAVHGEEGGFWSNEEFLVSMPCTLHKTKHG